MGVFALTFTYLLTPRLPLVHGAAGRAAGSGAAAEIQWGFSLTVRLHLPLMIACPLVHGAAGRAAGGGAAAASGRGDGEPGVRGQILSAKP